MGFLLALLAAAETTGAIDLIPGFIGPPGPGQSFGGLFGGGKQRRRRRRRMLTASDRGDIAFLSATLGKGAAKELAAIRLAALS